MKIRDVYEPYSTLARLVVSYGMAEVLASLGAISQLVAQNEKLERNIREAEWLRDHLLHAAERTRRFNAGESSAEDQIGQN